MFLLSLFLVGSLLIFILSTFLFLSESREDRNFRWPSVWLIVSAIGLHFIWQISWIALLKAFSISICIGLFYSLIKWVVSVKQYHSRVLFTLNTIKTWPSNVTVATGGLDVGKRNLVDAKNRKDALEALTPQFSDYYSLMLGWVIFWPIFLVLDIAPINLVKKLIKSFTKPAQYFANKIFEEKDV